MSIQQSSINSFYYSKNKRIIQLTLNTLSFLVVQFIFFIQKDNRMKIELCTIPCMMVNYNIALKAYQLYDVARYKIFIIKDICFKEFKIVLTNFLSSILLLKDHTFILLELKNNYNKSRCNELDLPKNLHTRIELILLLLQRPTT